MAEELNPEASLIGAIMAQNASDAAWVSNQLMDGYKRERDEAWAELQLIRNRINYLLNQDFAPGNNALADALYPDPYKIEALASRIAEGK